MFSIHIIQGFDQGERLEIAKAVFRFGRDSNNDLQLRDAEVSRFHAELRPDENGLRVVDLDSSNGTFVNGSRVSSKSLSSGDRIQMGKTHIVIKRQGNGDAHANLAEIRFDDNTAVNSEILDSVLPQFGSRILPEDNTNSVQEIDDQRDLSAEAFRSHFEVMYQTTMAVSQTLDVSELLERVLSLVFEWVKADRACVLLIDQQTGELHPSLRKNREQTTEPDQLVISRRILDYVIDKGEGVVSTNASRDDRWEASESIVGNRVNEAICVPLTGRYGMVGVIYIDTAVPDQGALLGKYIRVFTNDHLRMLAAIGHQTALALEDTYYYQAMLQSEKLAAMGQTATSIAHYIKNMLQGIRGGAFVVEEGLQQEDYNAICKGWDIVKRNQDRISGLVLDMLSYAKDRQPECNSGSLQEIVSEVVSMLLPRASEVGVVLKIDTSTELEDVWIDVDGIHRALWNVISNSLDATSNVEGAVVKVSLFQRDAVQFIRVEDQGIGIAKENLERIFVAFFSDKGGGGTGLGLAVSRKILREHNGDLTVTSVLGEGSVFELSIPVIKPDSAVASLNAKSTGSLFETGIVPPR